MRRKRGKYKRCGRLGYNARRRIWFGKKRKWEKSRRYQEGSQTGRKGKPQKVNPTKGLRNEERLEGVMGQSYGKTTGKGGKGQNRKNPRRMKDTYRNKLIRRTGRKRRYGQIPRERLQKQRRKKRERQKEAKNQMSRRYRKGEWRVPTKGKRGEKEREAKETREKRTESRFGSHERRVDVRRWRSGRVQSIQTARDLVEHGKVEWRDETGTSRGKVKWEGKRRKEGQGRKVEERAWKKRKEQRVTKYGKREEEGNGRKYERKGIQYVEADYVSGRRRLHRKPKTGEIWVPEGMERTRRR